MSQNQDDDELYFESQVNDYNGEDLQRETEDIKRENNKNEEQSFNINITVDDSQIQAVNNLDNSPQIETKKSKKNKTYTLEVKKQVINEVI